MTLEARPPNLEGQGEITIRDLLRNALHMRPDRIIVGECRSGEALDMLQAMTTGQDGSLSTGHANTPRDMLRRLETMVLMTGYELPLRAIREQIASAVDIIVHTARLKDGSRKVVNITEVYGIEDDEILTQDIFTFEQTGINDGKVVGELKPTGIRPTFMPQFKAFGVELPPGEYGIPPDDPDKPTRVHRTKSRFGAGAADPGIDTNDPSLGRRPGGPGRWHGLRLVGRAGRSRTPASVIRGGLREQARQCLRNLRAMLEANGSVARARRLGQLDAARPGRVRHLQRGVGQGLPGLRPGRPVHAHAAPPATGRVPRLDRGHRRGTGGHRLRAGLTRLGGLVARHTRRRPTPGLESIELYLADDIVTLSHALQLQTGDADAALPYWAVAWGGGLALGRYLLEHPALVAGRRVLDLGAGSGVVAIAAMRAGAASAVAVDIDPLAVAAIRRNARANGVRVRGLVRDVLAEPPPEADVIVAGDCWYEAGLARRVLPWLRRARASGIDVLVGDPGRDLLPVAALEALATYEVRTTTELEDLHRTTARVYRLRPHDAD